MLTERDRIETWPEMGISFEPVKLDIHLPLNVLDPKRLEMIGLASTLPLILSACGKTNLVDDFFGGAPAGLVNLAGFSVAMSFITENKTARKAAGAVGFGLGIIFPPSFVFGGLFLATGAVIKIEDKIRDSKLSKAEKQAKEDLNRAQAMYHGIRQMRGKE